MTNSETEISLIVDTDNADKMKQTNLCRAGIYKVLQFHEGCSGIDHIGIVQKLSMIFSKNGIPIVYVNSFSNNFVLIPESDVEKSKVILRDWNL